MRRASDNVLVGIVFAGITDCGHPDYPSMYMIVSEVRDWIKEQTSI